MSFANANNEETVKNELDGDLPGNNPIRPHKKLLVYESRNFKDKLLVVDLHKIQRNLSNRIAKVNEQLEDNLSECASKNQDDEDKFDNSGEAAHKEVKNGTKAVPAPAATELGANEEGKSNECAKLLRKMTEETFRESLKKYGYKVASSNAFVAEGGYGSVFRVHKGDQRFACKVVSNMLFQLKAERGPVNTIKLRSRFSNEVEIMRRISSHPYIVKYVESFTDEVGRDLCQEFVEFSGLNTESSSVTFKNFFIIMEYANAKTLSFYVKNRRCLPEGIVKSIFCQVTDAVKFMHGIQIAHRDIKLSNLLLQSKTQGVNAGRHSTGVSFNYVVKLCDFGLSSIVDPDESCFMKPVGTSFYMAPDILRAYYFYNRKKIDQIMPYCAFKGDVWALGVCIFYCLHGYYPLDILCKNTKAERMEVLDKIFSLESTVCYKSEDEIYMSRFRSSLHNYHNKLSFNGRELLCRMLEVDAKKRADIVEVVQHIYLRG